MGKKRQRSDYFQFERYSVKRDHNIRKNHHPKGGFSPKKPTQVLQHSLQTSLSQAIHHHKLGEYERAEKLYITIIQKDTCHFDGLQLLGTLYAQTHHWDRAVELLSKAHALNPLHSSVLNNLGFCYKELKEFEKAIDCFNQTIRIKPDYSEAYNNRGNVYKDLRENLLALIDYESSIIHSPQNSQAYYNLSQLYFEQGLYAKAIKGYDRSLIINPHYHEALTNKALVQNTLGESTNCIQTCEYALKLNPHNSQALNHKGTALKNLGLMDEAIKCFKTASDISPYFVDPIINHGQTLVLLGQLHKALSLYCLAFSLDPASEELLLNRAVLYKDLKKFNEALQDYETLFSINPKHGSAYFNRANLYSDLGLYAKALKDYDLALKFSPLNAKAFNNRGNLVAKTSEDSSIFLDYVRSIEIDPGYSDAYNNLGVYLHERLELDKASACFSQAALLNSTLIDPIWNSALVSLLKGDYDTGFKYFESRWDNPRLGLKNSPKLFAKPIWLGQTDINNKKIILYCEQGLGDSLQFSRYIPLLVKAGAKITLFIQLELVCLLKEMKGLEKIIPYQNTSQLILEAEQNDFICPLMSLALAFKTNLTSNPPPAPFEVKVDTFKKQKWRAFLEPQIDKFNNRLKSNETSGKSYPREMKKIGIVWSGRQSHENDRRRSIAFSFLFNLLPKKHVYVSLQKEIRESDLDDVASAAKNQDYNFLDVNKDIEDFSDTAAIINALDLVICVDTSVAHLAGSMNKPTWILLPYAPDWRWLLETDKSSWYPGLKVFRQTQNRHWGDVLQNVSAELNLI